MNTVLFLCTGNYYRSRFAEIVFNSLAKERGLPWQAASAGLRVDPKSPYNPGPLSPHAHAALLSRGILLPALPPIPANHPLASIPLPTMGNVKPALGNAPPSPDSRSSMPEIRPLSFPRQVTESDLAAAHLVIALKESEHRPLMTKLHPNYAEKITYWQVHDLDCAGPQEALTQLESQIHSLLQTLTS